MTPDPPRALGIRTAAATLAALTAFAANSILCRLALGPGGTGDPAAIDAAGFTAIRLASGAVLLAVVVRLRGASASAGADSDSRGPWIPAWTPALLLFLYAAAFSFAYVTLTTGTGALLLFGAVQITMIARAILAGERPTVREWGGLGVALVGFLVLVFPGLAAPSVSGSLLMIAAGVAWGVYSLVGRGVSDPVRATANNFARAVPLVVVLVAIAWLAGGRPHVTAQGAQLAVVSGALASGLGYVVWYAALAELSRTRAATVQLAVPVIAAVGGVVFLSESVSGRLCVASGLILGGVALASPRKSSGRHPRK